MFKNILVATDMVTGADAPVLTAIDLARQYQAQLNVLHVLESASTDNRQRVKHYETNDEIMVRPAYFGKVKNEIRKTYSKVIAGSDRVKFTIRTGYPWEQILGKARAVDTDLIILGPHSGQAEKKGVIRVAGKIGSTVQGVVTRESCPVMIINKPVLKKKLLFRKIVVGIDFSISCECALCFSVKLSQNFNSFLYPFFMIPVVPYPKYRQSHYKADRQALRQKLEKFCDVYLDGTGHEYKIWGGALPYQEVLKCAGKTDADLIILGSHTKMSAGKWYTGSVVEQVSFKADCPVLAVNDPAALKKWKDIRMPALNGEQAMDRSIHLFQEGFEKNALLSNNLR
ncbi:MAG: universal stress protein [Desulfobacula sp.]|nr:universal stress protein [Desulfobacula sp.]MCK5163490.1 universal stress protein [Desulfobacula sp.]